MKTLPVHTSFNCILIAFNFLLNSILSRQLFGATISRVLSAATNPLLLFYRTGTGMVIIVFMNTGPRAPPFAMNYENAGSLKPVHSVPPGI